MKTVTYQAQVGTTRKVKVAARRERTQEKNESAAATTGVIIRTRHDVSRARRPRSSGLLSREKFISSKFNSELEKNRTLLRLWISWARAINASSTLIGYLADASINLHLVCL